MNAPNPLDELASRFGSGKASVGHGFMDAYYMHFAPLREQKLTLLEIGIATGASLRMWEEFFPNANLFAVDIDPAARAHETVRSRVMIGDQSNEEFLAEIARETGPIDIVIDDGSHHPDHHLITLNALFPHVKTGGLYVIEDLASCFSPRFGPHAGLGNPGSSIEYLKGLMDVIHGRPEFGGRHGDPISSKVAAFYTAPEIVFLVKGETLHRADWDTDGPDLRKPALGTPTHQVRSLRAQLRRMRFRVAKFGRRLARKLGLGA